MLTLWPSLRFGPSSSSHPGSREVSLLTSLVDRVLAWHERHGQRRRLMELDERMLKDIGLSRSDLPAAFGKSRRGG